MNRMSEVFKLPVSCSIDEFPDGRDGIYFTENSSITENQAVMTDIAINNHDQLTDENARLREALTDISNMCVGEIAMGYKLDSQSIGELIFEATGLTNPELNELLNKDTNKCK